jgi:ribosome biogenesis protein Nip4
MFFFIRKVGHKKKFVWKTKEIHLRRYFPVKELIHFLKKIGISAKTEITKLSVEQFELFARKYGKPKKEYVLSLQPENTCH